MQTGETILHSDRLLFRKINFDDFALLKVLMSNPNVMYAWEHTFSDEQVRAWIQTQENYYKRDGVGYFAVIERNTNAFVGQAGLHRFELNEMNGFEVCYMLNSNYWHQGFATESVNAFLRYAREKMNLDTVYAQIKANNIPSIRVAQRCDFTKQIHFIKHYNGKDMEHILYQKILK